MKRNNRLHRNGKRFARQQEAKERQAKHDGLTREEKIEKLMNRRGWSKKEAKQLA